MNNFKNLVVLGLLVPALTGCWETEEDSNTGEPIGVYVPITSTIGANFVKGPVTGADCELFEVSEAGAQSASMATGMTTAGVVNFGDTEYMGAALVQCSGGTYTDEATGEVLTAPEMRAVVNIERDTEFSVTPLTEMATQLAEADGDLNTAISSYNSDAGSAFGFSGDITTVLPTDLETTAAANDFEGQYAIVLALLSQFHSNDTGLLADLIDGLSEDLEDGEFSQETLDSLSEAVVDLDDSEVAASLDDEALATIVAGAGLDDGSDMSGVAQFSEDDDIGLPGNDIDSVSAEIVDTNLVITQTHKGAKDNWHTIRAYFSVDDTDTLTTPMAGGAVSLTGLAAEYGYIFERNDVPGWNISKQDVTGGAWVVGVTTATATGGVTNVTTMTIPLSEIGDPTDISEIKMMFVGTGAGWGTDQIPNDTMYQYVATAVAEFAEDDDEITPLGNNIESVSAVIVDTNLVVTQTHKAAKDNWHTIRAYFNVADTDTLTTPMAGGAGTLTGLVAEYGYIFERNDVPGWNVSKQDVTGGVWVVGVTTATASGGDTNVTTMTIPLSEIGDPTDISVIKMMFVGTGAGWGTDQIPNDAMFDYTAEEL